MTEQERAQSRIEQLLEENRLLREKLDLVLRKMFGRKSEQIDPAQLELLLAGLDEEDAPGKDDASASMDALAEATPQKPKRKKKKERKPRVPEHLPVVETVIEPDEVTACPEAWSRIGEEVSEMLDYEPGRFLCQRTIRPKYVKRSENEAPPVIASLPPKLIEAGIVSAGLMAHIIIQKFCDHLPLYRQEKIFEQRYGVKIPRQTMARWIGEAAQWVRLIYDAMREEIFAGGYIEVDETPIKYLSPGAGKAEQGYLWTYHNPGGDTLYDWHTGRSHHCLESFIPKDYSGILQCDGYAAYNTFAHKRGKEGYTIILASCWAHVRRKFHDAYILDDQPTRDRTRAAWILRQIQNLYMIERKVRESRAGPALRHARRRSESRMITERIHRALLKLKSNQGSHRILPNSLLGKAIRYALNQWDGLVEFLNNGRIEIDNNLVENAIRPTAIGKKNWLFVGSEGAGWRSAILYTLIESCRSRGIDPHAYLLDILTRLPSATNHQIPNLTPKAWQAAQNSNPALALAS